MGNNNKRECCGTDPSQSLPISNLTGPELLRKLDRGNVALVPVNVKAIQYSGVKAKQRCWASCQKFILMHRDLFVACNQGEVRAFVDHMILVWCGVMKEGDSDRCLLSSHFCSWVVILLSSCFIHGQSSLFMGSCFVCRRSFSYVAGWLYTCGHSFSYMGSGCGCGHVVVSCVTGCYPIQ